jgi:hypothetical protein
MSGVTWTKFGGADNVRLTFSDEDSWVLWEFAQIDIFYFILHTPLDSAVLLHSKNLKASCSTV